MEQSNLSRRSRFHRAADAQELVDPGLENRGNGQIVHRRSDDDRIRRFDFPDKLFGKIERPRRRGGQSSRRRQCSGIQGGRLRWGIGAKVTPDDVRARRNLKKLLDDRQSLFRGAEQGTSKLSRSPGQAEA